MSGTGVAADAALTDAQKVDVRRFCGYPAFGSGADGNAGWRFYQAYGALEYRMNNLSSSEIAVTANMLVALSNAESLFDTTANDLDTDVAGPWARNKDEVRDRSEMLGILSRRLCAFLGVPPGPAVICDGLQLIM